MEWFKFYDSIRTDKKMNSLSPIQFQIFIFLLCLANEQGKEEGKTRGRIDGFSPMKLAIEVAGGSVENLNATLDLLEELEIIRRDAAGILFVNWKKRQKRARNSPSDQPEAVKLRVEKLRAQRREQSVTTSNEVVTSRNALEEEKDLDIDPVLDTEAVLEREDRVYTREAAASSVFFSDGYRVDLPASGERLSPDDHLRQFLNFIERWPWRDASTTQSRKAHTDRAMKLTAAYTAADWRRRTTALERYLRTPLVRDGKAHYPDAWLPAVYENYLLSKVPATPPYASWMRVSGMQRAATDALDSYPASDADDAFDPVEIANAPLEVRDLSPDEGGSPVNHLEAMPLAVPAAPPGQADSYSPYIAAVLKDFSTELGEPTAVAQNINRGLGLWRSSGLGEESFVRVLYEAKKQTRRAQGGQRPPARKMAHLLAVAGNLVGGAAHAA